MRIARSGAARSNNEIREPRAVPLAIRTVVGIKIVEMIASIPETTSAVFFENILRKPFAIVRPEKYIVNTKINVRILSKEVILSPPGKPKNDNDPISNIVLKMFEIVDETEAKANIGVSTAAINAIIENFFHPILILRKRNIVDKYFGVIYTELCENSVSFSSSFPIMLFLSSTNHQRTIRMTWQLLLMYYEHKQTLCSHM